MPSARETDTVAQAGRVAKYRESAQALRVLAFRHFHSEEARRIVLETAEKYDRLADSIERRNQGRSEASSRIPDRKDRKTDSARRSPTLQ